MSMITGCPACGTMFRVVPDQLKISDGWVRCGHCGEVFDASAQLHEEAAASRFADAEPAVQPPAFEPTPAEAEPVDVAPLLVRAESASPARPSAPTPEPAPALTPAPAPAPVSVEPRRAEAPPRPRDPEPEDFADAQFGHDALTDAEAKALRLAGDSQFPVSGYGAAALAGRPAPGVHREVEDADPADLSFVRQARRSAFWRQPGTRVLLAVAALVLAALLMVQYALQERDRLAATHPSWRPWLRALCAPLSCTIGPPQRIEAILIDNSGFTRLRPDVYRLSFSLRNQAPQPVAIPALQLTLTDTSDEAVLQRVFTPAELGAASDTLAPSSEFAASLALALDADAAANRIAGYRLLAFYP